MIRAALYARVSSAAQRDAHTIENQLRVLRAYIKAQGWDLAGEYIDDGYSAKTGKLDAREGFERLLRDAEAHKFDVLVVVDVDRLSRTGSIEERALILGPFQRLGIAIATPSGGVLDLRSFLGEFWVTIQALVAAEENRKRAERIKAGKLRAIAEGRKPAGPTPFGLRYDRPSSAWSLEPTNAATMREIFHRVIAGEACGAIAEDFYVRRVPSPRGPWSQHKVWALVRSRHAVGEWTADKRRKLTIAVPAIIDEATWQLAQAKLLEHGKRGLVKTKHVYLLEGLAVCGKCGSPIAMRSACGEPGKKNLPAYVCRARKLARIGEARCDAPILHVTDADARVWEQVAARIASPSLAIELAERAAARSANRRDWAADLAGYQRHLERLGNVEKKLLATFRRGLVGDDALEAELGAIRRERAAVQTQLAAAERGAKEHGSELDVAPDAWLAALRKMATSASKVDRQRVVRALVKKGSAVFEGYRIALTLQIEDASASLVPAVPAVASFYRNHHETALQIKVVARCGSGSSR